MIQSSRWSDELQWATKGVGGSVIKIFWSIDLDDLLIQNELLNFGATFILSKMILFLRAFVASIIIKSDLFINNNTIVYFQRIWFL